MIYFDHASTTPIDKDVLERINQIQGQNFGNPSSSHQFGQTARKILEDSRDQIAQLLNCQPREVIFTSGGSESNNLALKGLVDSFDKKADKIHIVTTEFEHKSILKSASYLEKNTGIMIDYLKPNKSGEIEPEQVRKIINSKTRLVSIIYVNNELGTIQPIREIGKIIQKINQKRSSSNKIYFHSDAVQAIEYLNCDIKHLHLDLLSLSAHKFYGPKGVGALFIKENTPLAAQIDGGGQEMGLRSGTENVPGIAGLAEASKKVIKEKDVIKKQVQEIKEYFEDQLKKKVKSAQINSNSANRSPHISNVTFPDAEGESIMLALDLENIAVSTGSACAASDLKPSHVLTSTGLSPEEAQSTIRFSFGKSNNKKQVDKVITELAKIVPRLQKMSPK
jgi:cysteine desulfurase